MDVEQLKSTRRLRVDCRYLKNKGVQSHSVNFRHGIWRKGIIVRFRIQAITHSGTCATSSTLPLLGAGTADPELPQPLHLRLGIVAHFLYFSCGQAINKANDFAVFSTIN